MIQSDRAIEAMTEKEFHSEFLSFQKDLKSYLLRILGNKQDSEDLSQDAYIKASQKISSFKGNSTLKTWVFSIATNLARDHFRGKQRWSVDCMTNAADHAKATPELMHRLFEVSEKSPAGKMEIKEHIDFCFTCIGKTLPIENQIALILKDIYNFKVAEIMQIMDLSEGKVKHAIADARNMLIHIFDRKCALVSKTGACYQCSELNGILNPKQNQQEEIMKVKMAAEAKAGLSNDRLYQMRAELIQTIDPLNAQGSDLHNYFLELMPHYSK